MKKNHRAQGKAAAAVSLALVLLGPVALFLGIRILLVNVCFGAGDPVSHLAAVDVSRPASSFKGSESCRECHPNHHRYWGYAKHAGISCETCHGPAGSHVEPDIEPRPKLRLGGNGECLQCHGRTDGRSPQVISLVDGFDEHLREIEKMHVIKVKRAKVIRRCALCHDPHILR
ncbi:MAG: hypothetical protein ACYS47_00385 [Planctomycetota bacterium]